MNVSGVDNLLAQMRSAMSIAQGVTPLVTKNTDAVVGVSSGKDFATVMRSAIENAQGVAPSEIKGPDGVIGTNSSTDFFGVFKSSLDKVAQEQNNAESMQQAFVLGDKSISLSDVMIETQKASMSHQKITQVRTKVIAAYNDIMNMQI